MVNAWSLAESVLNGTLDEDYPIMTDTKKEIDSSLESIELSGGFEWTPGSPWPPSIEDPDGGVNTSNGYQYFNETPGDELDDLDKTGDSSFKTGVSIGDYESFNLNIQANSPYNDGWTKEYYKGELEKMSDNRNKYHEKEILKDIEEYVSRTYNGHYTGTKHEYRNVQTIDLMASRDLASDFCQANILKYGSRYGSKDGKNKTDLMKVIHYAMLLLHFDEHYGKPSITSGNIDHNMP